jgi:hypothetical protein
MERDPLCSCGKGKDVEGMHKVAEWAKLAPFAVRVAFSPLFAVSYLEKVGRDPAAGRCFVCRGKGKPKMNEVRLWKGEILFQDLPDQRLEGPQAEMHREVAMNV